MRQDAETNSLIKKRVLITGATGYVGGRLLKELEKQGRYVRCLTRRPKHLRNRVSAETDVIQGDVLDLESLKPAFEGIDVAYYLAHSMGSKGAFEEQDRRAATNFSIAAREAGAQRIIYLGGLSEQEEALSPHLRSRLEVGRILRESGVPTPDSISSVGPVRSWGGVRFGNRLVEHRSVTVEAATDQAFEPIRKIGGETGWRYGNWLWRLRGLIDYLFGGVGLRRGRRDPEKLRAGESIDFWRVEEYEPGKLLRLFAEMKLPGRAWLEFEVKAAEKGAEIHQTAIFDPLGILGQAYWHALYPLRARIFSGMLRNIAKAARKQHTQLESAA